MNEASTITPWFKTYYSEICALKPDMGERDLCNALITTRRTVLRQPSGVEGVEGSLPAEATIRKLDQADQATFDMRYALLLIYFERHEFGGVKTSTVKHAIQEVERVGQVFGGQSSLLRILAKEAAVRSVRKFPKRKNAWETNAERIRKKYPGFYVLLRLTSEKVLTAEFFGIEPQGNVPRLFNSDPVEKRISRVLPRQIIHTHWQCESEHWVGDMVVGYDKFGGILLKDSLLSMPDPMNFTILRHKEALLTKSSMNIGWTEKKVLTGMVVGASSKYPEEIFRTPLIVAQIPNVNQLKCDHKSFVSALQNDKLKGFLRSLAIDDWPGKDDLIKTFIDRKKRLHRRLGQELLQKTTVFDGVDVSEWL